MSKQLTVFPRPTMPTVTTVPEMATVPAMAGERSPAVTISSEILVAAIVFLFMVVVFVFFLYLYARRYLGPNPLLRRGRSGTRLVFAADLGAAPARRGLDPAALAALPVVVVGRRGGGGAGKEEEEEGEALECAVCLCEVGEGEEARLLPKCNHGFHVECIDMWLHSHSTCPLCRSPVVGGGGGFAQFSPSPAAESAPAPAPEPAEPPIFPTNVLFWGTQDRINAGNSPSSSEPSSSSSRTRELVIEIPRRAMGGSPSPISPLPVSRMSAEEMKSPPPPSSARLRSLRRLLSRGKQAMGSSCSPRGGDIEQGSIGGAATPRTPTS